MYASHHDWSAVDDWFIQTLSPDDAALNAARDASRAAGLPDHELAPNQAKLLYLMCQLVGAQRVLEVGTLAGYSTIWFARAVGPTGHVTTLEIDPTCAEVSRQNFVDAQVDDRITLIEGPARDSLNRLVSPQTEPFDVVFLDADKQNSPHYLTAALALTRPGSLIIADNVVRNGAVIDPDSDDDRVQGVRTMLQVMSEDPRLEATAFQTVGITGWDGMAIARVK